MQGRQEGSLLVARGTGRALLTGKGDEHLVPALGAANAGEAFGEVATLEEGRHGALDDRPPEAVLGLKPLVVDLLECLKVLLDHAATGRKPADCVGGRGAAGRHRAAP